MSQPPELYPPILRVLVGSHAHRVAGPDSDFDYREVFVIPTTHLLQVPKARRPKMAWAGEHRATDDEGGWEVESFLEMCLRGHPNAIELLCGPIDSATEDGIALRNLFGALVSRPAVCDSYLGYAKNARQKLLDRDQGPRMAKWAATYLRVLWQGARLVATGELVIDLTPDAKLRETVLAAKAGRLAPFEALAIADPWERQLVEARSDTASPLPGAPDLGAVNDWLLGLRHRTWR